MCRVNLNSSGRVEGDTSIIARPDGSFYNFNGGENYEDVASLIAARPELSVNGCYAAPQGSQKKKEITTTLPDSIKAWLPKKELLMPLLQDYIPFVKPNFCYISNVVRVAGNGELGIIFKDPDNKKTVVSAHYRYRDFKTNKRSWRMLSGSSGFAFAAIPAGDDGYVYATFGSGDYLVCRVLGLRYLCFGSDTSVSKKSPYTQSIGRIIGAGCRRKPIIRVIADNDESGQKVIPRLKSMGFRVQSFNWAGAFAGVDTAKWDLRDIAKHFEDAGHSEDYVYDFIRDGSNYA